MLSVDEALERILLQVRVGRFVQLPLLEALGHVLAEPVGATIAVPQWNNSAMDGFAVRAGDTDGAHPESPKRLLVTGQSVAGRLPDVSVAPGTAVRIMTGAPLPDGADAVVPFEETDQGPRLGLTSPNGTVAIHASARPGQYVRPRGEDLQPGQRLLEAGRLLGPAELGLLASVGIASVSVVHRPSVAILSTGDELVSPGHALAPGQIYDANTYTLAAAVREAGGAPRVLDHVGDNPPDLEAGLAEALDSSTSTGGADLVLTTAGVSMGDHDFVRAVLEKMGNPEFWQIRMRPGRPLVFGHLRASNRTVPLVGLPGNPVSALLTFLILVRPAILKMRGLAPEGLPSIEAVLDDRVANDDGRRTYARVLVRRDGGTWRARLTGAQGSALLTSVASADGLAVVPEDVPALEVGQRATVLLLKQLETQPARLESTLAPVG